MKSQYCKSWKLQARYGKFSDFAQNALDSHDLCQPEDDDFVRGGGKDSIRQSAEPILYRLGMTWEADVQKVYPIVGTLTWVWMKEVPFSHKGTIVTPTSDFHLVRDAVELSLTRWPILRTVGVEHSDTVRLLLALRAQRSYFDRVISVEPEVESAMALSELPIQTSQRLPGKLFDRLSFHAAIARVKSTGTIGIVFSANHAVYDAISIQSWATDLNGMIRSEPTVTRAPYKMFTDAYYLYQNAKPAEHARDYHRSLFKHNNISPNTLWPPDQDLVPLAAPMPKDSDGMDVAGTVERAKSCPSMKEALIKRGTHAAIIVNMAICLFNNLKTGQPYSIFSMLMAGRSWPFMNSDITAHLPDPNKIAGPTSTSLVNVTRFKSQETIAQLFTHEGRATPSESPSTCPAEHVVSAQ